MADPNPLPAAAQQRLGSEQAGRAFTSDLSVEEYVLLEQAGFDSLGLVMGTSIYHVGIQVARWGQNQELTTLTNAMYQARILAMQRMLIEAHTLGADGITGVKLGLHMYAWGQEVLEFTAMGTAIRFRAAPGTLRAPSGWPFSSDLSAREFYLLHQAGKWPVGLVMGVCVYHIAHQGVMQSLRQVGQNVEMPQFTNGIYEARELALNRMQTEADQLQAQGVVGVDLTVANHVWGEHATEFFAVGTAVRPSGTATQGATPTLVLPL